MAQAGNSSSSSPIFCYLGGLQRVGNISTGTIVVVRSTAVNIAAVNAELRKTRIQNTSDFEATSAYNTVAGSAGKSVDTKDEYPSPISRDLGGVQKVGED